MGYKGEYSCPDIIIYPGTPLSYGKSYVWDVHLLYALHCTIFFPAEPIGGKTPSILEQIQDLFMTKRLTQINNTHSMKIVQPF